MASIFPICITHETKKTPQPQRWVGSYYLNPYLLVLLLSRLMPAGARAPLGHTHIVYCNSGQKSNRGAACPRSLALSISSLTQVGAATTASFVPPVIVGVVPIIDSILPVPSRTLYPRQDLSLWYSSTTAMQVVLIHKGLTSRPV